MPSFKTTLKEALITAKLEQITKPWEKVLSDLDEAVKALDSAVNESTENKFAVALLETTSAGTDARVFHLSLLTDGRKKSVARLDILRVQGHGCYPLLAVIEDQLFLLTDRESLFERITAHARNPLSALNQAIHAFGKDGEKQG